MKTNNITKQINVQNKPKVSKNNSALTQHIIKELKRVTIYDLFR